VDQYYFEAGYLEAGYLTVVKEAAAGLTPYFVEGYLPVDYFVFEGNAINGQYSLSALLTQVGEPVFAIGAFASITTTTASVNVIASGASNIAATFTQSSTISHIEGADLFAFSNAQLEAAVRRIRDNNITASAVFSVAVDVTRTRNTSSDDSAQFSFTANTVRSRDYASSQSAAFSLAGTIDDRTRDQSSALASQFAFTATISHIEGADLTAFSNADLTATATRIKQIASTQSASTAVVVDAKRLRGITGNLATAFTQTTTAKKQSVFAATLTSVATLTYRARPWEFKKRSSDTNRAQLQAVPKFGANSLYSSSSTSTNPSQWGFVEYYTDGSLNYISNGPSESITIEFWLNNAGSLTDPDTEYVSLYSGSTVSWSIRKFAGTAFGVLYKSNGFDRIFSSEPYIPPGQFNHIAVVLQSDGRNSIWINGTRTATQTSIGSPNGGGKILRIGKWAAGGTGVFFLDELRIVMDTVYDPNSSTITVPTQRFWNADIAATNALFHYDVDFRDDIGIQQFASADISSSATVTAAVDRVRFIEFAAAISGEASTATTGQRVRFGSVSVASVFAQSADVARTRGITSNQLAVFTQSAEAVKTANIVSSLDSQATFTGTISHIEGADLVAFSNVTLTANVVVTRNAVSTQSSAFTSSADILRVRFPQSTQTSQFNQTAVANANSSASSSVSSQSTQAVDYIRNRSGSSSLSSQSTLTSDVIKVKLASAALNSNFNTTNAYYDPDYIEVGYFKDSIVVQVKTDVQALLEGFVSQFNASVKTARVLVDCAVVSTLTANVRVTSQANAALTLVSELLAYTYLSRTARISSTITSAATLTGDITGLRTYSAALDVMAVVDCEALKTGNSVINISSQTTLTAQALRIKTLESSISSLFSINIDAVKVSRAQANLESASTVSAVAVRSVNPVVQLSSAFTFIAQVGEIQQINLVAFSNSTLTADVLAGKFAESNQSAAFTQTAAALRFRDVVSAISSNFTQTATVGEIVQLSSTINSQATVSADVNKTARASSSQTAVAIVNCIISHIEGADLVVNGFASLAADVDKIVGISVSATSAVNLAASADKFRAFNANLVVSTTVVANAVKALLGQATLQAQATIVANATRIKQFTATIASALTFVAQIREIDAASLTQFVYTIPREDYVYIVPDEVPVYNEILYVIPNENWTYNITAETRVFPVDEETRIYNIRSS